MLSKVLRVLAGASIAGALVMSASVPASAATIDNNRVSVTILGVGSDTTFEGMNDLDQLYMEAPGCAVTVASGFTNWQQKCLDATTDTPPGTGLLSYDGPTIVTENLYHDRVTEAQPVGSSNGVALLAQAKTTGGAASLPADFARSSSKKTLTDLSGQSPSLTAYGTAFARDGLGYWLGKTNVSVNHTSAGPNANISIADLKGVFVGNGSGQCLINYAAGANDAVAAALGSPGAGTIKVFATQVGSGTGKDFLSKIDLSTTYTNAAALQNCIAGVYKDSAPNPSDHVIFENNAKPICKQTGNGGAPASFQKNGIFPYSFARFTQNKGGVGACAGRIGRVDGVAANLTTIGNGGYPLGRYVYDYFYAPTSWDINDPSTWTGDNQTRAVLDYLHPTLGWLCQTTHAVDPVSGLNIRTAIENVMQADGFAPIASGAVGGSTFSGTSYCRDAAST
jgi:hypothetical protein